MSIAGSLRDRIDSSLLASEIDFCEKDVDERMGKAHRLMEDAVDAQVRLFAPPAPSSGLIRSECHVHRGNLVLLSCASQRFGCSVSSCVARCYRCALHPSEACWQ